MTTLFASLRRRPTKKTRRSSSYKEQKGVFTGGYEVKFKIRGEDYSLLVDLRNFIETDQTGEKQS